MEQARKKDKGEELDVSSQAPAQPNEAGHEQVHPHVSRGPIQTGGGAYIGGSMTSESALAMLGGTLNIKGNVYIEVPPATSQTPPTSYPHNTHSETRRDFYAHIPLSRNYV